MSPSYCLLYLIRPEQFYFMYSTRTFLYSENYFFPLFVLLFPPYTYPICIPYYRWVHIFPCTLPCKPYHPLTHAVALPSISLLYPFRHILSFSSLQVFPHHFDYNLPARTIHLPARNRPFLVFNAVLYLHLQPHTSPSPSLKGDPKICSLVWSKPATGKRSMIESDFQSQYLT